MSPSLYHARSHVLNAVILAAVSLFGLANWSGGAHRIIAQSVDLNRATVVQSFFAGEGRNDLDGVMATFAANAVYVSSFAGAPCSAQVPCTDAGRIRAQLAAIEAMGHFCPTVTNLQVAGTTVMGQVESRADSFRANGIEHVLSSFIAVVPQDRISALFFVSNLGDAGSATQAAITAGTQAPGAPIPAPSAPCG